MSTHLFFKFLFFSAFIFLFLFGDELKANCRCICSNGTVKLECKGTKKFDSFCFPKICPKQNVFKLPKSRKSYPPPITTKLSDCQQRRVLNPQTNKMIWRTICRSNNSF